MPKAKSPKKANLPLKNRAIRAALDLSAEKGWAQVSLNDIARHCKTNEAEIEKIFKDRMGVLVAYGQQLDERVESNVSVDLDGSERDRLFDVMMERFDALNEDRAAMLSILSSFRHDPRQAMETLPHLGKSMTSVLDAVGINPNGPCGAVRIFGLTGAYLYTVKAWMDDESADLSRTMAALDRALEKLERLAGFLKL